ncbi:hypothetical protein MBLNU230_g5060t1 [Neophaeotheca triangularis]
MSLMFTTKVPGIGGASIHSPSIFRIWRAGCVPQQRIVKPSISVCAPILRASGCDAFWAGYSRSRNMAPGYVTIASKWFSGRPSTFAMSLTIRRARDSNSPQYCATPCLKPTCDGHTLGSTMGSLFWTW